MKIVKFEEIENLEFSQVQELLQKSVEDFNLELTTVTDPASIESELLLAFDENEARMGVVKYELDSTITFDEDALSGAKIRNYIADFLDRMEVDFRNTLGVYQLIKHWRDPKTTNDVSYGIYDSTIRILGTLKYKGFDNHRKVLAINEYMSKAHNQYQKDTTYITYLSVLHSAVLDAMKEPEIGQVNEGEGFPVPTEL